MPLARCTNAVAQHTNMADQVMRVKMAAIGNRLRAPARATATSCDRVFPDRHIVDGQHRLTGNGLRRNQQSMMIMMPSQNDSAASPAIANVRTT